MARTAQRERSIQAVISTGRTPGRNVEWSEFCDLVRAAARVPETSEGFPRGWSNAATMNATKKISRGPAVLCERCKTEIALANALDAEPDVDRLRHELLAGDEAPSALPDSVGALRGALRWTRAPGERQLPDKGDPRVRSARTHPPSAPRADRVALPRRDTRGMGYQLTVVRD